ncbi:MAG: BBP7 family outer membrane beta-barrel protein [Gemmataceae bacterium]|nr:BBP7 family outer membrane beta-barrel protein [Gemmataceae bacterium]
MRNGFLAAAALVLGNASAQAQYWPAQQPSYPAANRGVWVMPPQAPAYYRSTVPSTRAPYAMASQVTVPNARGPYATAPYATAPYATAPYTAAPYATAPFTAAPRAARTSPPSYLPRGYFPAPAMIPPPAPSRAAPPEPVRADATADPEVTAHTESTANTDSMAHTESTASVAAPVVTVIPPTATRAMPRAAPTSRVIGYGPALYFDTVQASIAEEPKEPIVYHRECHEKCFASAEYLLGWITHSPLNIPLVTTGPAIEKGGAIGSPGTIVLFGNRDLDYRMLNGVRLEAGVFADEENRFSADVSGFYFLPRHVRFRTQSDSDGLPIVGRPIFNAAENDEDVYQLAFPLVDPDAPFQLVGSSEVDARVEMFGVEVNGRWHAYCRRRLHTEALAGFRTVHLMESLRIQDSSTTVFDDSGLNFKAVPLIAGDTLFDQDYFETNNRFYGFQVGGRVRWELDRAFLDFFGKLALGVTDQQVRIEGQSSLISAAGNLTSPGGILALPSNMGDHRRQVFGVIPEFGVNLGVDVTDHVRLKAGYSCLVWSGVARPGSQIDRAVNPVQVPTDQDFAGVIGAGRPEFQFRESVFFLQSFNFGLEFHF